MRLMQCGTAAAFVSLVLIGSAQAQQPCTCAGAGDYASGPIYPTAPVSEPPISQALPSQPLVTEFVAGDPILGGMSQDQPVVTGELITPASIPSITPVVTGELITPATTPSITPIVTGEVSMSTPISTLAPVVTSFPARQQVLPYSYWVLAPNPSRVYVDYGEIDRFPFYGRPYGNPSDRWSWYYLGGGDSRYLAKYYYPILQ